MSAKIESIFFANTKCHKKNVSTLYHGNTKMPAKKVGLAGIRTQVARFKVWSANHYTTKPFVECGTLIVIFLSFGLQPEYLP